MFSPSLPGEFVTRAGRDDKGTFSLAKLALAAAFTIFGFPLLQQEPLKQTILFFNLTLFYSW